MPSIPRRTALQLMPAAAVALGMCQPDPVRASLLGLLPGQASADRLASSLERPVEAARIGARALARYMWPADAGQLAATLTRRHEAVAHALAGEDRARLRATLALAVRDDFARGDTLRLDGWLLARTEAELYAIANLMSPATAMPEVDPA